MQAPLASSTYMLGMDLIEYARASRVLHPPPSMTWIQGIPLLPTNVLNRFWSLSSEMLTISNPRAL